MIRKKKPVKSKIIKNQCPIGLIKPLDIKNGISQSLFLKQPALLFGVLDYFSNFNKKK